MIFDDCDGQWYPGMDGPKFSRHLSYSWGKTTEETSTRKTDLTGDQKREFAMWEATMLHFDHSGGLNGQRISPNIKQILQVLHVCTPGDVANINSVSIEIIVHRATYK